MAATPRPILMLRGGQQLWVFRGFLQSKDWIVNVADAGRKVHGLPTIVQWFVCGHYLFPYPDPVQSSGLGYRGLQRIYIYIYVSIYTTCRISDYIFTPRGTERIRMKRM